MEYIKKEKKFNILFSSDLHGNIIQYKKLFKKAYNNKYDAIIIGGDILPKNIKLRTIGGQRNFLEKKLIPLIKKFKDKNNEKNHNCDIYLMMGNDDYKANYSVLRRYERKIGFKLIHNKCIKLYEDFKIVGYSYVPLTPFITKDWEKLDLIKENENKIKRIFVAEGIKSKANKYIKVKFNLKNRKDTIEKDLRKLLKNINPRKIILVCHSPPYNTKLDMLYNKEHVGSIAVRKLIEEKQPYLTLHGHIHETVDVSGNFMENIKDSICISSGNNYKNRYISIIKFNLYDLKNFEREII